MSKDAPLISDAESRYAHVYWDQVGPHVLECFKDVPDGASKLVTELETTLGSLDAEDVTTWRTRASASKTAPTVATSNVDAAWSLAELTAQDGKQRALDRLVASLEELLELRLEMRDALRAHPDSALRRVMPWIWQPSSTGHPLTESGRITGYELRFSLYKKES